MKRIYHLTILLAAMFLIAGCAGGKKVQPDITPGWVKLPETVPESFSYRITDKQAKKMIMGIEPGPLGPANRLEVKLLQQLASIEHPDELDAAFDRIWGTDDTLKSIIKEEDPPSAFIPALALSYYMLTHDNAYNWRDQTAEKLYERSLQDIQPEQLNGYPLHFYTLALLKNGKFDDAWPFLKQLKKKTTPSVYREDLMIALDYASENENTHFAGIIIPYTITHCRQNDLKVPEKNIAGALESFKKSGNIEPVAVATLSGFSDTKTLEGYSFYKYIEPYQKLGKEKAAISGDVEQWKVLITSPGVRMVSEQQKKPGTILSPGENPKQAAYNWLAKKGFEEGRNIYKGKLLYISVGSASVNATPQDNEYIDSRYLAFQRAELEAKAKTAIYLGVDLTTERGCSEREISLAERARLREIYEASEAMQQNAQKTGISDRISRMLEKSARLNEARLDQALREAGVDLQKDKRQRRVENLARWDRMQNLRSISDASVKAAASAFAEVQGTQIIQAFEGSYHGNYQVVVITLWSSNLERMVKMMENGTAPMPLPKKRVKKAVIKQLPNKNEELACLTGVRAYIDQGGEHVLLGFGQAGVEVIGGRADKAYERAEDKARLRAMAALRNFMGERLAFTAMEELSELLTLYTSNYQSSGEQEYHAVSRFNQMITAQANRQKIIGVQSVYYKELHHPFTGRPMVLKMLAWSPTSQAMAQDVKRMIEQKSDGPGLPQSQVPSGEMRTPAQEGVISSGEGADPDAW